MLEKFFNEDFMPHGHCYFWTPELLWSHVISDAVIAIAYFSIPLTILYFIAKRRQLPLAWVLVLFATFIVLCGITHVIGIITVWKAIYGVEAIVKVLTAVASVLTAVAIIPLVPRALNLKTAAELEAVMKSQRAELKRRTKAEKDYAESIERLQQSNNELQHFAYVVSHDLQAPLRSVVSFTELLERKLGENADEEMKEFMDYIRDGGKNMQGMIEDILSLSRIETQGQELEDVNSRDAVYRALENLQGLIDEKQAQITIAELPRIKADVSQIEQLIQNLISNAIKFQPQGNQPQVSVTASRQGQFWHFVIKDNGIGIDSAEKDRIFDMFTRLHTREEYDGTGIGLSICRKIIDRHGGRIWVESEPGQGTEFHFTLRAVSAGSGEIVIETDSGYQPA